MAILLKIGNKAPESLEFQIETGERLGIGRSPQVDVSLPHDRLLSLQHCEISFDGEKVHLRDLDSTNGTWYQNRKINRVELQDGDSFTAGETTFQVVFTERAAQAEELSEQNLLEFLKAQSDPLFALLDSARDEQVWQFLEELPPEQYQCLFTGHQARTLAKYGPHLVNMDHALLERLLPQFWGESWGYFLSASCEFEQLLQHLRQFLLVKDQATGKERFFRFYDPRVLRRFLPTCSGEQLMELFGPINKFLAEDANPSSLLEFTLANKRLHRSSIPLHRNPPVMAENATETQPENLAPES
jgi:pSer/pThr/pTyr-binding forkhead associated (FHA) protein